MAYVLVAIGAVMAAAGLYTVAYSILNTRFEEYWAALGVGVTLMAGGTITIALGLAVRAIARLTTALELRSVATPADEPAPAVIEPSGPALEPSLAVEPAATASEPAPILVESAAEAAPPDAPVPSKRGPHPLRPPPPPVPAHPASFASPIPAATVEPAAPPPFEPLAPAPSLPHTAPFAAEAVGQGRAEPPAFDSHAIATPRPADDYKLETPSTPEHDLPERAPTRPELGTQPEPAAAPDMPDDWLDRAFAELDEELPVEKPADHVPSPAPLPDPATTAAPDPEPAMAEPAHALAATHEGPPLATAPVPAPANPQVIGRYEADGTSYVMYADGSIEAQSSSGVYRFASMAELKSFIET